MHRTQRNKTNSHEHKTRRNLPLPLTYANQDLLSVKGTLVRSKPISSYRNGNTSSSLAYKCNKVIYIHVVERNTEDLECWYFGHVVLVNKYYNFWLSRRIRIPTSKCAKSTLMAVIRRAMVRQINWFIHRHFLYPLPFPAHQSALDLDFTIYRKRYKCEKWVQHTHDTTDLN